MPIACLEYFSTYFKQKCTTLFFSLRIPNPKNNISFVNVNLSIIIFQNLSINRFSSSFTTEVIKQNMLIKMSSSIIYKSGCSLSGFSRSSSC